jgi:hypothetical protein
LALLWTSETLSRHKHAQSDVMITESLDSYFAGKGYTQTFIKTCAPDYRISADSDTLECVAFSRKRDKFKDIENSLFTTEALSDVEQPLCFGLRVVVKSGDGVFFKYYEVGDIMNGNEEPIVKYSKTAFKVDYSRNTKHPSLRCGVLFFMLFRSFELTCFIVVSLCCS